MGVPEIEEYESWDGLVSLEENKLGNSPFGALGEILDAPWEGIENVLELANDYLDKVTGEETQIYTIPYDNDFDYSEWNPLLNPEDNWQDVRQIGFSHEIVSNDCETCILIFPGLGLRMNPMIYCRRNESSECTEEPIPEGVETEDEEIGTETIQYELPGGIYYLPKATQFSRFSRPYRFWRDDKGAIKTSPIVSSALFRQQRTMYQENKVSEEIIKAHGGMFISDTYHPDTWIKGEIFPLYSQYDEQGNPASGAVLINENQQSYVPKVFVKCSRLLIVSETESQGEEKFTHTGIFYQLCSKWESIYTWHAPSYAGINASLHTVYHEGLERRVFRRRNNALWANDVVEVSRKYLGDPLFLQIPNILAYHISSFDWRRGRGEGLWIPACDDRMYPDYRHFEKVSNEKLICAKRVPQENIMARCCSGIQCSEIIRRLKDTQKKLKEIEKTINKFEDVVAPDKFPVQFPRKLIDPTRPKGGGSVKLESYPRLFEYLMRQHDRTAGQWPFFLEIGDTKVEVNSIADALQQHIQIDLETGGDTDILMNVAVRILLESGITHKISAETRAELSELIDWIGFEGKEAQEKIPMYLDPTIDGTPLDKLQEEETEKLLPKLLREREQNINYYENRDEHTLVTRLMMIQKETNAAATAVSTPVKSKFDIWNALQNFDLNKAVTGLELIQTIRKAFLASAANPESFEQYLADMEKRYSKNNSPIPEDNQHDYQLDNNPATGLPVIELEPTEHITSLADEFRPREPNSEFWSKKKGFGDKNYQTKKKPRINTKKKTK